jgi:glycosyltransferase involved in cell wall biosynthesis
MTITVVIPLYNKKDCILRSLDSVLKQQVLPDEIIVVNDGSTDGSEKKVENLNHPLITLVHQKNKGVSAARNKGIEVAKGEWIAFLDADDLWNSTYLEEVESLSNEYPNCSILGTAYELEDYKGVRSSIKLNKLPFKHKRGILSNYFEVASCSNPPLWSSAVVIRKTSLINIGCFPVGITSGEDLLTWARLSVLNKIAYNLNVGATYVLNESYNLTQRPSRLHDLNDPVGIGLIKLYEEFECKSLKTYISHWFKMRASVYARINDKKNAIKYCFKSLKYNIVNFKVILLVGFVLLPQYVQKKIKLNY